ncbi:hypothetical protein [Thermococcus sp.]|uniref:hypothetical protein n=1 Tax=Thermococcus sp. TaxID=35749 RepID=UPI00260A5872|nr:hypothetical protein [Thermococcus sp.]
MVNVGSRPILAVVIILLVLVSGCIGGKTSTTSTGTSSGTSQIQTSATSHSVPPWEYGNAKVIKGATVRSIDFHWKEMGVYTGNLYLTYSRGIVTVNFTGVMRNDRAKAIEVLEEVPNEKPSVINITVIVNGKVVDLASPPVEVYAYPKVYRGHFGYPHSGWLVLYRIPVNESIFNLTLISRFDYGKYTSMYNPEWALAVPVILGAVPVVHNLSLNIHYTIPGENLVIPAYGIFSGSGTLRNFNELGNLRYAYIYPNLVVKNVSVGSFNITMVFLGNWYSGDTYEKLVNVTRIGLNTFAEYTGYDAKGRVWYVQHPYLANSYASLTKNAVYLKRYLDYGSVFYVLYEDWLLWSNGLLSPSLVNFMGMWPIFVSMRETNPQYAREFVKFMDSYALGYTSNLTLAQAISGNESGNIVFGRGFFVLRSLSAIIGNESMAKAYRVIFKKYSRRAGVNSLDTGTLQRIFENVSGQRLDWFFEEWFKTNLVPSYNVKDLKLENGSAYRLTFRLVDSSGFTMPVEIAVYDSNGTAIVKKTVWVRKGLGDVDFVLDKRPLEIVVDPGDFILNPKVQTTVNGVSVFVN